MTVITLKEDYFKQRNPEWFYMEHCDNCDKDLGMGDCTEHWGSLCSECFAEYKKQWEERCKK